MDRVEITRGNRIGHAWEIADGEWLYSAWIHDGRLLAGISCNPVSLQQAIDRLEDAIARSW